MGAGAGLLTNSTRPYRGNRRNFSESQSPSGRYPSRSGGSTRRSPGSSISGTLRTDYPLPQLLKDAAALEDGARRLAAAAPKITKLLQDLNEAVVEADERRHRRNDMEVEKEIWKRWASDLGQGTDYKTLDLDVIEDYLQKIGIWKELGIDIGTWFSSEEQILAGRLRQGHTRSWPRRNKWSSSSPREGSRRSSSTASQAARSSLPGSTHPAPCSPRRCEQS